MELADYRLTSQQLEVDGLREALRAADQQIISLNGLNTRLKVEVSLSLIDEENSSGKMYFLRSGKNNPLTFFILNSTSKADFYDALKFAVPVNQMKTAL